jgi:hypothetical protein
MLGGALAGFLKVAAIAAVTAGMGGGVYLLAQADDNPDQANVQAPVASADASPTAGASTPTIAPPTPTLPALATATTAPPTATPSGIDTSNWQTYESPLGFTINYPPEWALVDLAAQGLAAGTVKISNPNVQNDVRGEDDEAWLEITPNAFDKYDRELLFQACGVGDASYEAVGLAVEASEVTFAGLPAVRCSQVGPTHFDPSLSVELEAYWLNAPAGIVGITSYAIEGSQNTDVMLRTMLDSISF